MDSEWQRVVSLVCGTSICLFPPWRLGLSLRARPCCSLRPRSFPFCLLFFPAFTPEGACSLSPVPCRLLRPLFPPLPSSPPSRARGQSCPHRVRKAGLRPARPCHAHCFLIKSLSLSLSLSLPPSFLPSSFPSSPFLPLFSLRGCARCPARFVLVLRLDIYTYIPMYIYTCIHTYIHTYIHICTGAAGRGP